DFNDLTGANWPSSTAGGTNSVTMTFDNVVSTTLPSNGLTYAWTPPVINDLAVAHTSPANISCFSGSENYTVTLTNNGNQPWNFATSNVTVSGAVTGPLVGNYNVVLSDNSLNGGSPLGVGASLVISLATLDLRAPGAYVFTGSHNASDANAGNNSSVANRTGNNPVAGLSSDAPVCDNAVLNLTSTATGGNNTITSSNSKTEAPALNIPDNSLTGVGSTLTLAGTGTVGASSVVTVGLNITHTFNGDLDVYLVGPSNCGTLELTSDNGVGSDGINITLTTSGNPSVTTIPTSAGLVTGSWNYEGSVTVVPAFNSGTGGGTYTLPAVALSGCPVSGTWTLYTFDDANLDVGAVNSWSLSVAEGTPSGTYTHSYTGPGVFGPTSYSGAANSQGDVAVTGLTAGSQLYDVVVTDVNGCSSAPAAHTALIQLSGCTDPIAVNFNALALCEDGSCLYGPAGDLTTDAISIGSAAYPSCSNSSHNLGGFYDSPESAASGPDKWLSVVAGTSAISIELNVDGPVEVELLSLSLVSVGSLSIPAAGTWNFNVTGLTAGDTYLLSLTDTGASGVNANVCSRYLPDSRCDYGSGPYTLCNTFKADWVGSVQYVFNFTSTTTANTYTKNNGTSTFCILSTVPGLTYGDTYDTRIDAIWNVGGTDITVIGDEICQVIVSAQPTTVLRPSDNCDNFGPHLLGQSIAAQPFVCGAINWKWEFTRTDVPELPITHYRGSSNRFLALTSVPGLVAGATYDVRVAPVFSYGDGAFGSTDCISIVGAGGIIEMNNGVETIALVKIDNTTAATALVYPNPNRGDMINLSLENITDEVVTVDVIDMFGRVVFAQQYTIEGAFNTVITFDNQLASGMYLLNVQTSAGMMTERIMVQH
ncbi:MAG: T9SS type A sorting domain-containing protein, partial [Flavobacteriales bacterium]|nr:T9SS type A sorting domain-containing protein [Flavobacteriales bacterium]